jgi:transcriptional regulator with GAF, ATPase, and Fis domain
VDVRVIAATHRNLADMVNRGEFRKDLWFRLNVFPIHLPPLRQRREDIPEIAVHIARLKARDMNLAFQPRFAPEAMDQLRSYEWPGNIRELQNIIEHRLILSGSSPLSFPDLSRFLPDGPGQSPPNEASGSFMPMDTLVADHIREALRMTDGKIYGPGGAAELLRLNPSTLQGKMRKYGIPKP